MVAGPKAGSGRLEVARCGNKLFRRRTKEQKNEVMTTLSEREDESF